MKKTVSLFLALVMATVSLAGCGTQGGASSSTGNVPAGSASVSPASNAEAMPHLVMSFSFNDVPADIKLVEGALNEILKEKIGCTVDIVPYTYGNTSDKQTLVLSSPGEQMDLMMGMFRAGFGGQVAKGQLRPLDDLLDQYGPGVKANIDPQSLKACTVQGEVYGILTNRDLASQRGFVFLKSMIDEQNITLPEVVTDLRQMTPVFEKLHAAYPDMYGLASSAVKASQYIDLNGTLDQLTDSFGVLSDLNDLTVSNLFESKTYREFCTVFTEWNKAGYIYPDILIDGSNNGSQLMRNGNLFCYIDVFKPGAEVEKKTLIGQDVVIVPIANPTRVTLQNWSWVIPENAVYPEKAMQIIDLLYTDEEAINLLSYGIEGTHWLKDANGFVIDGPSSSGYPDKKSWATGNGYLAAVRAGDPADVMQQLKKFNETAKMSKALGFLFNSSELTAEYTALQNTINEYRVMLEWGFADDVDATIKKMNEALYAAGLQKYMDAKQTQLNTWATTN